MEPDLCIVPVRRGSAIARFSANVDTFIQIINVINALVLALWIFYLIGVLEVYYKVPSYHFINIYLPYLALISNPALYVAFLGSLAFSVIIGTLFYFGRGRPYVDYNRLRSARDWRLFTIAAFAVYGGFL